MNSIAEVTLQWANARQIPIQYDAETGSTNENAKADAFQSEHDLSLFLAAHQTHGRGRGTNQWKDTGPGDALLCTFSVRMVNPPQAITAPRVGLSVFQAAQKVWLSLSWSLKAPNDLYLGGKKIGGLLVESVSSGSNHRLLVGFGFNVSNHPRSLNTATHLAADLGHLPDEGEWFRFLDELRAQLTLALADVVKPTLTSQACADLCNALNANPARPFAVAKVSPNGDLHLDGGGIQRWTEL